MRVARVMFARGGLLLVGGGGLTSFTYRRDLQQARARVLTSSHLAETRCGPIEYATVGEGSLVLIVHGAGGGFDQGLDFAKELAERGFRVIAMSRFGYLRTPADASAAVQADAHACRLDALMIQRAAVIGASAGALDRRDIAWLTPEARRAAPAGGP
ncbi:MAG: alpha/beta fold hydrolase [Candidatus Entotheonellia bacterium]